MNPAEPGDDPSSDPSSEDEDPDLLPRGHQPHQRSRSRHSNLTLDLERPQTHGVDPNLAAVLETLSTTLSQLAKPTEETKAAFKTPQMRAPQAFNGIQPSKLQGLLQSCQLIFHNDDKNFATDCKKVLYAVSYLSGCTEKWIEPYLFHLDNMESTYIVNSWINFEAQLYTLFSDPHEVERQNQASTTSA